MMTTEQKLSESLLAACKAAGIDKPMYITQNRSGDVYHNNYKPRIKNASIWCYNDGTKFLNHPPYAADWQESLLEWVDHVANTSKKIDRYTVEPHGKGYAVYLGRDNKHHGANLAHLSECSPAFADQVQALLNGSYTPQVNQSSLETLDKDVSLSLLLAKQRDALAIAMKCIERHGVIMGSTGDYRQGQLDILESVKIIATEALAAVEGGQYK
jgi:hypothetical protein